MKKGLMKMNIAVHGRGRMCEAIVAYCKTAPVCVAHIFDVRRDVDWSLLRTNNCVVVDFSSHHATFHLLERCAHYELSVVMGTTGHSPGTLGAISQYNKKIPVVKASNFSTGVNTLFWLTRKAAKILGPECDAEIVEMHHRLKKDAPSGTAKTLGNIIAEAYTHGTDTFCYGREGNVGERPCRQIGIHAIRGGDVVGDHTVIFATSGERVELTHKATSREAFASGALRAAEWIVGKPPGLYDMQDVLGLK